MRNNAPAVRFFRAVHLEVTLPVRKAITLTDQQDSWIKAQIEANRYIDVMAAAFAESAQAP